MATLMILKNFEISGILCRKEVAADDEEAAE
jgi:hypothetical protein